MQPIKIYKKHVADYLSIVWPVMINLLSFVFISLADKLMIARLGGEELVGANSVTLVAFIPILLSVGCCTVLPSIVATDEVRKTYKEATDLLYSLLLLSFLIAFVFSFLFVFSPMLLLKNMPIALFEKIKGFFWTISISAVFAILIQPLRKYLEGLGYFRLNMAFSLLAGLSNIILNFIFIYGYLGVPAMGITGAGIATLIVRIFNLTFYLYFVFIMIKKKKKVDDFKSFWSRFTLMSFFRRVGVCLPGGGELFVRGLFYGLADRMLYILYSDRVEIHAAGTILFDVIRYTSMISLAAAITSTILMARAHGKNDKKAELRIGITGYMIGFLMAVFAALLGFLGYPYIIKMLESTTSMKPDTLIGVTESTVAALMGYAAFIQIADSLTSLGICLLRGKKDVAFPVIICILTLIFLGLPTSYILGVIYNIGIRGVLLGIWLGYFTAALGLFIRFAISVGLFRKKNR